MQRPASFLGGLSAQEFTDRYWKRKPLLVQGALPKFESPISAEELLGLACEQEVESRLVLQDGETWQLERGPFVEQRFAQLEARSWTVLVQDLEQHVPETQSLMELLDFLPHYCVDDLMASVASDGGSVGPHYDHYDVFLLQAWGTRRWQIAQQFDPNSLSDSELSVLSSFTPEQEWLLQPGDLLYLPPNVAHYGVAMGDCVTLSLGCRAPSMAELVTQLAADFVTSSSESQRLRLSEALPSTSLRAAITPATSAAIRAALKTAWQETEDSLGLSFARLMTQPKALFARDWVEELDAQSVEVTMQRPLIRRKGSRWLHTVTQGCAYLVVDGEEFPLRGRTEKAALFAERLCLSTSPLLPEAGHVQETTLRRLVARGHLEPTD